MGLQVKRITGAKLLFDMRGLWADERVDGNLWPKGGRLYRGAKTLEKSLLLSSDHVVTLTNASVAEIRSFPYKSTAGLPLSVIPTCTDLTRFQPGPTRAASPFVLGYIGSVGTWYLLDELLGAFKVMLRLEPDSKLLIANRSEHDLIRARMSAVGVPTASIELTSASHAQIPALIHRMSAGSALIKPAYSKIASAPTKLGEYLACGVPCLGNHGVGDVEAVLQGERVGVSLPGFSAAQVEDRVHALLNLAREEGIGRRCRMVAERLFSLERGVKSYRDIYRELTAGRGKRQ
jgi:glycosyltransferase involved in cell wall biosynthesis